ncbi:MAG: hypothetical protein N4A68_11945 [Maledivibacter sp.]|jgi:hypothetical protein|nr:hypothetical protein [Maledivibacter sp.]
MSKYSEIAVKAVELLISNDEYRPREAWDIAATEIFVLNSWGSQKGCPRSAFLGLCEEGLVKGVASGRYTTSIKNKTYAVKALEILKENPSLVEDRNKLWQFVMAGEYKSHNSQMDVVIALVKNNLIF